LRVAIQDEYEKSLELRHEVFVTEQNVPEDIEIDLHEKESEYFLAEIEGKPVGTGRFRLEGNFIKFERVAVSNKHRKKGVGKAIMEQMQQVAATEFPDYLQILHAQSDSIEFYKKMGWIALGNKFLEANIEHTLMVYPPADPKKLRCNNDKKTPPEILGYIAKCAS